jgi:hypothetical protein
MMKMVALGQMAVAGSTAVGASLYVDTAVAQGKNSHGSFTSDWAVKPYPKLVYSPAGQTLRENLWNETVAELDFAGAGKILNRLK